MVRKVARAHEISMIKVELRASLRIKSMSVLKKAKLAMTNVPVICTHSGSFHADESLAVFMLRLLPKYADSPIVRSRDPKAWEEADIVVDVSGKYDGVKFFDHHQREFNTVFSDAHKTKLSSAGLVYKHFGANIILHVLELPIDHPNVSLLYTKIYDELIELLDANDNGISKYPAEVEDQKRFNDKAITLPLMVSHLNPSWNESCTDADFDRQFAKASELMGLVFLSTLNGYGKSWLPARSLVEEAFKQRSDVHPLGEILVLTQFCPWKEHLYSIERENGQPGIVKFVLFQDSLSKWRISTVSVSASSFEFRKGLPLDLRGLRDDELCKKAGIDDLLFVHAAGFIGGGETKDCVYKLAEQSL